MSVRRCALALQKARCASHHQMTIDWNAIVSELKREAPLLFAVLMAAGAPPHPRNVHKGTTEESRYLAICTAAAVLLKERCKFMSSLQHLIGIILVHGNASKQVSSLQISAYSFF